MSESQPASNRNTILIVVGVVAVIVLCCCIIVAASAAFFLVVPSVTSGGEIVITPEFQPEPVTIQSFSVEPQRVLEGECAVLDWSVQGADQIVLLRDGTPVLENAAATDSFKDCYEQSGIFRYRLEAENNGGFYQWMELQVIVEAGASP
jgi:hypothetical protein